MFEKKSYSFEILKVLKKCVFGMYEKYIQDRWESEREKLKNIKHARERPKQKKKTKNFSKFKK